ncbi:MAG TPA: 2-isopropylmalate synthase [Dissulfurispiraceae bacterium]|nr:2-isopropylmalate synthase [Dissulfurispiraceae bacterium]
MSMAVHKYRPFPRISLPDRQWPERVITTAPEWCSVDLRDGNQALIAPMTVQEKKDMFQLLCAVGFKQIEVGFPSASQTEFDFLRTLVHEKLIPDDVTVQVLTQSREHLIKRTFEALAGVKQAVVHLYNSTSALQRKVVFRMDQSEIKALAVQGAEQIKAEAARMPETDFLFEYSPESFTGTELEFALEVCEAITDVWQPSTTKKVILNLPATVEMATPNVYADQIEWVCRRIRNRDSVLVSLHAHNDRGTAVAATELALLAGADRVEGTLFGNGERTGNVDIMTVAMNMFSQGVDPKLDFSNINRVVDVYERSTKIPVHVRHPYAGELVFTAFSGSHQDAINKGMKAYAEGSEPLWEVPYLPIDPADVGRTYESIVRINSQSGKGGVAFVMEKEFGFRLPKEMHPEFSRIIQGICEKISCEIAPEQIVDAFKAEYLNRKTPYSLKSCSVRGQQSDDEATTLEISATIKVNGEERTIGACGNGPIDALSNALKKELGIMFKLTSYFEHALEQGSDSKAAAYIRIETSADKAFWGVGVDTSIETASFKAIISALNRASR